MKGDVTDEKEILEQEKNELSNKLSSSQSSVIQPDIVHHLLVRFHEIYKQSKRNKQKQLFQLLINNISITEPKDKTRSVDKVELDPLIF